MKSEASKAFRSSLEHLAQNTTPEEMLDLLADYFANIRAGIDDFRHFARHWRPKVEEEPCDSET